MQSNNSNLTQKKTLSIDTKAEKKLLHYTGKAIHDYKLIEHGDKVLVALSGGKDSYTMLSILSMLQRRSKVKFELQAYTLDQSQPGWDDKLMRNWLSERNIPYDIVSKDTYSI